MHKVSLRRSLWIKLQTGAVSGESASIASPKGSQSQAKGQKGNNSRRFFVFKNVVIFYS